MKLMFDALGLFAFMCWLMIFLPFVAMIAALGIVFPPLFLVVFMLLGTLVPRRY